MGESFEARIAGVIPKIIPTPTENPKATNIDHGVTSEIKNFARISEPESPRKIPIVPPVNVKITASSKNCFFQGVCSFRSLLRNLFWHFFEGL